MNIIIVGATSGIGKALAESFASRGVRIGIAARRQEELDALSDRYPGLIETVRIDVTDIDAPKKLEDLIKRLGGLDLYIHVAGICLRNPALDPDLECKVIETDAVGFARLTSAVFNYFKVTGKPGQIAALSSVAGTRGIGELAAYSASKSFVSTYLEALEQLAHIHRMRLSITDIRPGWVRTPLLYSDKHYPMEMSLAHVLPQVLRAIVRKKRVAVIDTKWRVLCGAWRHLPRCIWVKMSGFGL